MLPRHLARTFVAAFILSSFVWLGTSPAASASGVLTAIEATLTDLPDEGGGDLWRIEYALAQDFAFGSGYAITISLTRPSGMLPQTIQYAPCGWSGAFVFADANLLSDDAIDQLKVAQICPGGTRELGGLEFIWQGATPAPLETHRVSLYDPDFDLIEAGTVAVPEAGATPLAWTALLALLGVRRDRGARRRVVRSLGPRRRQFAGLLAALGVLFASPGASRAAEPLPGTVGYDYTVGNYEVTLRPVDFERRARYSYLYRFEVRVRNTGPATASKLLVIGTSQNLGSVTDGLVALPALDQDETADLDPIHLMISRTRLDQFEGFGGESFDPQAIELCAMAEPTPGPALPESDLAIATLDQFASECANPNYGDPNWRLDLPQPPRVAFTPGRTYLWNLATSEGALLFELLPDTAPQHVAAILYLVRMGFYDGLDFHRVIQGFVAQGGDPLGTGGGGPGYALAGEFDAAVQHDARGVLSTAHAGPVTDGSQFFITFTATPGLDGVHTITGRLVQGTAVLDAIEALAAAPGCTGANCQPTSPIDMTINTIGVME